MWRYNKCYVIIIINSGEKWQKVGKVGINGEKWGKVDKSGEKLEKVAKSWNKWIKVGKIVENWRKAAILDSDFGQNR